MKKHFKILMYLILMLSVISIDAKERVRREKHYPTLSEINKTLNLGQRQSFLNTGHLFSFDYNFKTKRREEFYMAHVDKYDPVYLIPNYTYAISDSFQISLIHGLPSIQYLFLNNTKVDSNQISITGPNLAFNAGIAGLSNYDDLKVFLTCGLKGKFPLNETFWLASSIQLYAGNTPQIDTYADLNLGIQVLKRFSIIPGYELNTNIDTFEKDVAFSHTIKNSFKLNVNQFFDVELIGRVVSDHSDRANDLIKGVVGYNMNFTW